MRRPRDEQATVRATAPGRDALAIPRSAALGAAILAGLLAARVLAPGIGARLAARTHAGLAGQVTWGGADLKQQWYSYLALVAIVFATAAVCAATGLASRRRPGLWVAVWGAAAALGALLTSWQVVVVFGPVWAVLTVLLVPQTSGRAIPDREPDPRILAAIVVATAAATAAWGLWITWNAPGRTAAAAVPLVGVALLIRRRFVGPEASRRLAADAMASIPFLFLPLIGFRRAPSPWCVAAAAGLAVVLRGFAAGGRPPRVLLPGLAFILAPWAVVAVATVPLGLRELPEVNHREHEGMRLGWINSVRHGKLLLADAGIYYAPLRDYTLAAYMNVAGTTVEQDRIGSVLLNLAAAAALLAAGRSLSGGDQAIHWWFALLLIVATPLSYLMEYRSHISFGWADLGRMGFPACAALGAAGALRRLVPGGTLDRPEALRLFGWGTAAALSILQSHEFGLCALVAILMAVAIDQALRPGDAPLARRLAASCSVAACFLAGVVAVIAAFLAIYAAFGRASALVGNAIAVLTLIGSGEFAGLPFPVDAAWFLNFRGSQAHRGIGFAFCAVPAVYLMSGSVNIARAIRREWSSRATTQLVLTLLGLSSFKYVLVRSDVEHLMCSTLPAILLAVVWARDVSSYYGALDLSIRGRRAPLGAFATCAAVLAVAVTAAAAFRDRGAALIDRSESPSTGPPYRHPGVPRAGDVFVPAYMEDLVRYLRDHSTADDPIFCRTPFMRGPEIYFLADRRNPTGFDMTAEIITRSHQEQLFEQLKRDPPLFVVGSETSFVGGRANRYLDAGWRPVARFGEFVVSRRNDPDEARPASGGLHR